MCALSYHISCVLFRIASHPKFLVLPCVHVRITCQAQITAHLLKLLSLLLTVPQPQAFFQQFGERIASGVLIFVQASFRSSVGLFVLQLGCSLVSWAVR